MATELELNVVTTSEDAGLRAAADDLEKVKHRSDEMGHSFEESGKQSHSLDAEIERLRQHLHGLNQEYAQTGNKSLFRDISRDRRALGNLERIAKDIGNMVDADVIDSFDEIGQAARKGVFEARGVLIAGAVGLAAVLAPAIGAVASGAVLGTGVGVAMAGGILSAIKSPAVKSASGKFLAEVEADFFSGGSSFVGPIEKSLGILSTSVHKLDLADVFGKTAPYVTEVAQGIGNLFTNLMPGFSKLLDKAGPASFIFAQGLSDMGSALGDFLAEVSNSPGTLEGLEFTFRAINGTVVTLGEGIRQLSDAFDFIINQLDRPLAHSTDKVLKFLSVFDTPFSHAFARLDGVLGGTTRNLDAVGGANEYLTNKLHAFNPVAADSADAMARMGVNADQVARANMHWTTSQQSLNQTLSDSLSMFLSIDKAELNVKQSMADLNKAIQQNGKTWDENTQQGRDNESALLAALSAAQRVRDAQIQQAGGADASYEAQKKANAEYNKTVKQLLAIAAQAGATQQQLDQLKGEYLITLTVSIAQSKNSIASVKGLVGTFDLGDLANQHKAQHRASGGSVMAGMPYIINERANQEVYFPADGRVSPANLAPGGGAQRFEFVMGSGASDEVAALFALILRKHLQIQTPGGGTATVSVVR